ncbi:MAG: 1-acyl-sn-glycerol-3-phosphate acyltransferase, partial [Candidatus Cloacimonas sp.]
MKSLIWEVCFCLYLLIYLIIFGLYLIVRVFLPRKVSHSIVKFVVRFWARTVILSTGSKVEVVGKEN